MSSQNSLFRQVSLVFALDSELDQAAQFLGLNSLNLQSFILDALADLAALLEVVKSGLLRYFGVHANLVPNGLGMCPECTVSLSFKLALFILLLFLLLNYAEEFVALSLRLLGHHDFLLDELSSTSDIKILGLPAGQLSLFAFVLAGLALSLLEGALGTESINFTLSVSCALLEFSKTLNFELLLLLDTASFRSIGLFFCNSLRVVTHNFQIFLAFLSQLILLAVEGNLVGNFDLLKHLSVSVLLGLSGSSVLDLLLLNGPHHLLLLTLKLFSLLDANNLTLLNLLNDYGSTTSLSLDSQTLALILSLQCLQTLDFHHEIKAFLLIDPVGFEVLVLLKLLVTDGDNLGVEGHLIHVLDIVMFFIKLLLSLR